MNDLQKKIATTFAIKNPHAILSLGEGEVNEMAMSLPRVVALDAKRLAVSLMIFYAGEATPVSFRSCADRLIYFLDGDVPDEPSGEKTYGNMVREALKIFSPAEGQIVLQWLREVGQTRFKQLCEVDVLRAIGYWAKQSNSETHAANQ